MSFIANLAGGMSQAPKVLSSGLYSSFRPAAALRASNLVENGVSFKQSSLKRPLKLFKKAFWVNLLGAM
ncbi:MAG: hypothetical protein V7704_15050 [Aurantimonas endophytica]